MNDPIGDFITRIKNGVMAGHDTVVLPHSRMKEALARILEKEGYISAVSVDTSHQFPEIVMKMKYIGKQSAVTDVRRLSKPGRRMYSPAKSIPRALGGYGITIISTNKGVLTDKEARQQNIGGELLCQVW